MQLNTALNEWKLGETLIRKMTRLANERGAVNLSQGFADFDTPDAVKEAAVAAIRAGVAYVNVHSSTFMGGEVRGQLRLQQP